MSHRKNPHFQPLRWLGLLIPLTLLSGCWLFARFAANSMVPPGSEYQMWPPLKDDLRALNLAPGAVRADVYVMEFGQQNAPLNARYMLRGVDAAHLSILVPWQAQGVPERPTRIWFFGRSRPGKAHDCPQNLAQTMSRGRDVENAVLTWRERTPQGQRQATLTVWRAARGSNAPLICVESSRTLPIP